MVLISSHSTISSTKSGKATQSHPRGISPVTHLSKSSSFGIGIIGSGIDSGMSNCRSGVLGASFSVKLSVRKSSLVLGGAGDKFSDSLVLAGTGDKFSDRSRTFVKLFIARRVAVVFVVDVGVDTAVIKASEGMQCSYRCDGVYRFVFGCLEDLQGGRLV